MSKIHIVAFDFGFSGAFNSGGADEVAYFNDKSNHVKLVADIQSDFLPPSLSYVAFGSTELLVENVQISDGETFVICRYGPGREKRESLISDGMSAMPMDGKVGKCQHKCFEWIAQNFPECIMVENKGA